MRLLWDGGLKTGRTKKKAVALGGDYLYGSDCSHKLPSPQLRNIPYADANHSVQPRKRRIRKSRLAWRAPKSAVTP